jgi:signal transduction histidine kinase
MAVASETTEREASPQRPARLAPSAAWLLAVVLTGLLLFVYRHLEALASSDDRSFLDPLICEMSAAFGGGLMFFAWRSAVDRAPLEPGRRASRAPLYLALWLALSAAHTTWNWAARSLFFPIAGLGDYDYGRMPLRYFMELPVDTIVSVGIVTALHVARRRRIDRQRELVREKLERSLGQAQLHNLRLQLQPHFLFNALNTISSVMYDDVEAADRMIERLSHLLRASLRAARSGSELVTLAEELEVLEDYLAIVRARFAQRLDVAVDVEPSLARCRVPSFLLQPLAENAIRHGGVEVSGRGAVVVRARRVGQRVSIEVADDGPGVPAGIDPLRAGNGLGITAERLRLLYGHGHALFAGNRPGGGFVVRVELPFDEAFTIQSWDESRCAS